jgi:hypothetical protein
VGSVWGGVVVGPTPLTLLRVAPHAPSSSAAALASSANVVTDLRADR